MINIEKDIAIVIPSFNGEKLLATNLPKIISRFSKQEIIVVDDGSTDSTITFLKNNFPKIKIIVNKQNMGFASAANRGIFAANAKLVFLINNDCYPQNNLFNYLLAYFNDAKTFAVSCAENKNGITRGRGVGGFKRGLFFHKAGNFKKNDTLWAFGASTLYCKRIFTLLGGFDENFNPFYWEDFDLSYRALKSGYKIYFEKKALVKHMESSTINKYYTINKVQQVSFRNQFLTCWKNITDINLLIAHLIWLPYHLIWTNLKTSGNLFIGFLLALKKIRLVVAARKKNKFVYSDGEILEIFEDEI